jgi:putative glutamine amidotransferase
MHKNKQPVIGVTMSLDQGVKLMPGVHYSYLRRDYGRALEQVGAAPIYLDLSIDPETAANLCDGIIISGGEDIHPSLYGEEITGVDRVEPIDRSLWERRLIDACDQYGVPILGVCYGEQLLNVHYGGTLYQDIATEFGSDQFHGARDNQQMHEVTFEDDLLGYKKGQVSTAAARHHQAIKDLADGFTIAARAEDGIIEAIHGHGHFGIQWHPEADDTALQIYGEFVAHCTAPQPASLSDFLPEPIPS